MIGTKIGIIRQIKERSEDTLGLLAIGFVKEFYIIEVTKWGCSYE
ncbi:hypothetical protein ACSU6B_10280 [Neobacillus sp. C211]